MIIFGVNEIERVKKKIKRLINIIMRHFSVCYIRYLVRYSFTSNNLTLGWPCQLYYIYLLRVTLVQGSYIINFIFTVRGVSHLTHCILEDS